MIMVRLIAIEGMRYIIEPTTVAAPAIPEPNTTELVIAVNTESTDIPRFTE